MRKPCRGLLSIVLAVGALAYGASQASAVTATFRPGGFVTLNNTGPFTVSTAFGTLSCGIMTLQGFITAGTYRDTFSLTPIGYIWSANGSGCSLAGAPIAPVRFSGLNWTIALVWGTTVSGGSVSGLQILGFTLTESSTGCPFRDNLSFSMRAPFGAWNDVSLGTSTLSGACGTGTARGTFTSSPAQTIS